MRIVKIVDVVDTRDWQEEEDEVWRPIPNSGERRECDRCGRLHEIHAHVELGDGRGAIVGTGCMRADDMLGGVKPATLANRAKRVKQLEAEIASLEERLAVIADRERIVSAMIIPPVTWERHDSGRWVITCGDSECYAYSEADDKERRRERETCAISVWQGRRLSELGVKPYELPCVANRLRAARTALERAMCHPVA